MASPSPPASSRKPYEERKELDGPSESENWKPETEQEDSTHGLSRNRIICTAVCLIALLVTGAFVRSLFVEPPATTHPNLLFHGDNVRSNGTHDFKRTVLIVSIDGLRADYLDRGLTPHLLDISKQGLRAKAMVPVFPTLTFPNHWALMTGLYAESHGVVGNNFWDPISQSEFHYNQIESAWNPAWWLGEPMWETAVKSGIITANLMWPGPPKTTSGFSSTYFVPWKNKVPLKEKLDQLLQWIDLPFEERPQLLMAYEPSLDQAGHKAGPYSALVNKTLTQVDIFAKDLHTALKERNLTEIVDVVFVSDHGMTDTSHPEHIYMDDILGEGYASIEHEDGWPAMGLRFSANANVSHNLELLRTAAAASEGKFEVYTHETMPERYHFSGVERIAPIYVVPKIGYILTTHAEGDVGINKGNHGYDNTEPAMHAMFVAHGPFSAVVKVLHQGPSGSLTRLARRLLSRPNKGWHSTSNDTYVMDKFENVQIYSLVMRLLGVDKVAPTNGSSAFWDKYF
ncbi:Type I phosphodiesterase nucleotide pyrophosphatase [Mycena sanguinolenta]|uniref:Type I phosphodiesterase nucleotide pyrophosphatase n=1 Tax=Mycena sanguinolenta TaxID=230812 RepID=A0A8H6XXT0_9AGAR|nr:Type I phosphodiesterase nucleotide pyrophosphatase [Mycena sanguinolenta]